MKQSDRKKIKEGLQNLIELKKMRGGKLLSFHKKCANDISLLKMFLSQYKVCNNEDNTIMPRKYRELLLMAMGCVQGVETTIKTHAVLALENGASIEEIAEVLRLIFFYCGASSLIPAVSIFEELEGSEEI